jgi:hypothetical protein
LTYKKMKVAKLTNSDLINGEYSWDDQNYYWFNNTKGKTI